MHEGLIRKNLLSPAGFQLQHLLLLSCALCFSAFLPSAAQAGEISDSICAVFSLLSGNAATAIATLVILAIGLMAMFGKVSWDMGFVICAGIAILFGAANITSMLGHGASCAAGSGSSFTFTCNGAGTSDNMFDANQQIFSDQGALKGTGVDGVFSRTLYYFKATVGVIMSEMYCTISDALRAPLTVVTTLFVVVFGIMIATGISNFTLKEAGVTLFKLALIWGFAMNPDWGIGIGYRFFMGFAEEASNIVLSAIPHNGATAPGLTSPDAFITGFFSAFAGGPTTGTGMHLDTSPPCLITMMTILLLMLPFMPWISGFLVSLALVYFGALAMALLNYLEALVLISFLFIFAPFFLAFALFRTTMPLFEDWIKHLIGFTLQMVIMFAFLVFLSMIPFFPFIVSIVNLFKEYDFAGDIPLGGLPVVGAALSSAVNTMHLCSICQYVTDESKIMTGQAITCVSPPVKDAAYLLSVDGKYNVISLFHLFQHADLAVFIMINVFALWVLTKVIEDFMKKTPELASRLGNLPIAAALGTIGSTAAGPRINNIGLESIRAAYFGFMNQLHTRRIPYKQIKKQNMERLRKKLERKGLSKDKIEERLRKAEHPSLLRRGLSAGLYGVTGSRIFRGVFGTRGEDTEFKNIFGHTKVRHHRSGGIVQGFLHGAVDQGLFGDLDYAAHMNAARRADERAARQRVKVDAADKSRRQRQEEMDNERQKLEKKQKELQELAQVQYEEERRRTEEERIKKQIKEQEAEFRRVREEYLAAENKEMQERWRVAQIEGEAEEERKEAGRKAARGIMGGEAPGHSSIDTAGFSDGDQTQAKFKEMWDAHEHREKTGKGDGGKSYFLDMPQESAAATHTSEKALHDYKQSLESAISRLETAMNNSPDLSPDQAAELHAMIRSAKNNLSNASSSQAAGMVSSEIGNISQYLHSAGTSSKK